MVDLSIGVAFFAGVVSFLSPCVLPIIPGFLAYLAGTSTDAKPSRGQIFLHSLLFVVGFSLVFALLGVLLNTVLESVGYSAQQWMSRIGGIIIIFFGLYLTGLIHIGFLERQHKINVKKLSGKWRYLASILFGAAFAAGWTPCVGAALGAILGLAASEPGKAFYLLMSYALGLGVPFLVVGAFAGSAQKAINKYAKYAKVINIIFGILLIVLGVLIFTQNLARIANFELLNQVLLSS